MMTGGTGLPERALAPEEAGGPVSRILAWEWRGIASRTGQPGRDGRKLLVCMIEAVEILKVKRLCRTYC